MSTHRIKTYLLQHIWILKAAVTSWISACVDFSISFAAFAWMGCGSGTAAALGAIGGGVTNCGVNYRWTFRACGSPPPCVAVKYILVWIGSLLLNTYGTELLTHLMLSSQILDYYEVSRNLRFTIARLTVALAVSLFWNLRLQRVFVFRPTRADSLILKIGNSLRRPR